MSTDPPVNTTYIHATPEQLWTALTDPEYTRRYFDFIEGCMAVDSGWTPGGSVLWRTDGGQAQIEGRVLEIGPPSRLVTSFSLLYYPEAERGAPSCLAWEITPMGEVSGSPTEIPGSRQTIPSNPVRCCTLPLLVVA